MSIRFRTKRIRIRAKGRCVPLLDTSAADRSISRANRVEAKWFRAIARANRGVSRRYRVVSGDIGRNRAMGWLGPLRGRRQLPLRGPDADSSIGPIRFATWPARRTVRVGIGFPVVKPECGPVPGVRRFRASWREGFGVFEHAASPRHRNSARWDGWQRPGRNALPVPLQLHYPAMTIIFVKEILMSS